MMFSCLSRWLKSLIVGDSSVLPIHESPIYEVPPPYLLYDENYREVGAAGSARRQVVSDSEGRVANLRKEGMGDKKEGVRSVLR